MLRYVFEHPPFMFCFIRKGQWASKSSTLPQQGGWVSVLIRKSVTCIDASSPNATAKDLLPPAAVPWVMTMLSYLEKRCTKRNRWETCQGCRTTATGWPVFIFKQSPWPFLWAWLLNNGVPAQGCSHVACKRQASIGDQYLFLALLPGVWEETGSLCRQAGRTSYSEYSW